MNLLAGAVAVLLGASPAFQAYDGKKDGFKVDFPGTPKVEISKDKSTHTYTVDNEFGVYSVNVFIDPGYTPDDTKDVFDDFRKGEKSDAKLVGDKAITLGSLPGLELKTQGKDMDGIARQYIGKGKSWVITLDVDHGHTFEELGADRFFNSLNIGNEKAAPVATPAPAVAGGAPGKPAVSGSTLTPPKELSPDGVEVVGWTQDGSTVVALEHGIEEGRGHPWATITFFDTVKGQPLAKSLEVQLENDQGEEDAVSEGYKLIDAERTRLKLGPLVKGKKFKTTEKGAITGADGGPIGNLEIKSKNAGAKDRVRACTAPWKAQLYAVRLFLMGDDQPVSVLAEKKVPATRACSESCAASASYGQGKGAFFVLRCREQAFEGFGFTNMLLPVSTEFGLEADP